MCGRFTLTVPTYDDLASALGVDSSGLHREEAAAYRPRYNVAPTDPMWIMRMDHGIRELVSANWGFVPHGSKTKREHGMPINARSESARSWSMFRDAFQSRRCVVPSTGFFEWITEDATKKKSPKHPIWFRPHEGELLLFGGLWDTWRDPDSGADLRTFAILTTKANEDVASVHNRMPLILETHEEIERWLSTDAQKSAELLRPLRKGALRATRVSDRLNSVKNDDAACLEVVEGAPERDANAGKNLSLFGDWAAPGRDRKR